MVPGRAFRSVATWFVSADLPSDNRRLHSSHWHAAARYGRIVAVDLLAKRIQPDTGPITPYRLWRGTHGQRISVSVLVLSGCARSAPLLMASRPVTGWYLWAVLM